MEKLIITAAICGAEVTKADNPNLPVTPDELATAAYEAEQAGATIIHLHVRDKDGNPTQSEEVFKTTIEKIKAKGCQAIIQPSTGGAVGMSAEERMQPLNLKPEMATLSTGSVNFGTDVFLNSPEYIQLFAEKMKTLGVKPEIEVFETGMINNALRLVKKGLIESPLHFDFVMGVPGGIPGEVEDLLHLVHKIPRDASWSVAGIGRYELPLAIMAIIMGGHVRVGFEDNIYYAKGVLAESNAQLVARIVRIAKEYGREVATPVEARKILHLTD